MKLTPLMEAVCNLKAPSREVDAMLAFEFDTYARLRDGLHSEEIPAVIRSVTYRLHYDDVEIHIGRADGMGGGLKYSDKLPAFTASYDVAKTLLPDADEPWELIKVTKNAFRLIIRDFSFVGDSEALAFCRAAAFFRTGMDK